jgi:rubrerythrin
MALDTVDKILAFAISQEEHAAKFYAAMANKMNEKRMKEVFLGFAREEEGHKAKLTAVKEGKLMFPAEKRVLDLKIGDYLEEVTLSSDLSYREALVLAMKAERAAFRLYSDLASAADDAGVKATLQGLAQEEAKHKLRFEIEYDDNFLGEN